MISHEIDNIIDEIENHENLTPMMEKALGQQLKEFDEKARTLEAQYCAIFNKFKELLNT